MFQYFNNYKKQGQVAIYFIGIMVTMVVLAFIVINIGKIAKDKTYADNAADAGALAAATVMATAFNYVADANGNDKNDSKWATDDAEKKEGATQSGDDTGAGGRLKAVQDSVKKSTERNNKKMANVDNDSEDISLTNEEKTHTTEGYKRHVDTQTKADADRAKQAQKDFTDKHKTVHSDQQGDCDYYTSALVAGYLYNFNNAGVSHRLGRINQKRWQQFLQNINCQTVQNGTPLTFFWVDGAGRAHTVTAIMEIQPANNWKEKYDQESLQQKTQHNTKMAALVTQKLELEAAELRWAGRAQTVRPLWPWLADIFNGIGDGVTGQEEAVNQQFLQEAQQHANGTKNKQTAMASSDNSGQDKMHSYTEDIVHSQTVYSANFQFHMGGIVKGMRGDVDVLGPTFYPPVQSGAIASFNCKQSGKINPENNGNSSSFEACLIQAW